MADNSIDLVVSKEAFAQLDRLLAEIKAADAAITALNTNAGKNAATPSGADNNSAENAKLIAQMKEYSSTIQTQTAQIQKLEAAKKSYNREVTQESVNQTIRNQKAREAFKATSDEIDNYQRLDAAYKKAVKSAQDLGAQYGASSKQFLTAANSAKELDDKLKAIDGAVGKYGRNVGNYASGWNGLANSVNQLTREAPAFANSLNTGFMALSNNIPILADEINNLKIKNQELAATGKPTESIVATLAKSFFSWQTVLSVGVTLLTLYGSKLIDMARGLGDVEAAMNSIKKSQKDSNDIIENTTRNILHQAEIRKNKAREQGATEQELFNISKQAQIEVLKNLEAQRDKSVAAFNTIVDYRNKNYQDVKTKVSAELELEGKRDKSSAKYAALTAIRAKELKEVASKAADENAKLLRNDAIARENAVKLQAQKIAELSFFEKDAAKQKRERIVLDFSEEKSAFDLRIGLIEKEKQAIQDKLTSTKISSAERLDLEMELQAKIYDLEVINFEKSKALSKERGDDDKKKNDLALRNKDIDYQKYLENIKDIDNRVNNEQLSSKAEFDKKIDTLDTAALNRKIAYRDKLKEQNTKLTIAELDASITANKLIADNNVKNEEKSTEERQKAFEEYISQTKKKLEAEKILALAKATDPKEKELIEAQFAALGKALDNIKSPADNAKQAMKDFARSFIDDFAGNSGFADTLKMFDGKDSLFSRIQKGSAFTKDSWKADTVQMMEAAQEMYNFIANASQQNFDAEYERLDKQKEVALQFAGESASAREKVEEDYEAKKKEIVNRENKAKKKQAIFNIGIDTAQAILSALAAIPPPANIPFSIAVGLLGAAQMAVVAAQKIPQYFDGTDNHPGGLALINDGKGANYKETVVTPDGKVRQFNGRDVMIDAPAGTQVFTHEQWNNELNTMMREKGVSMSNSFSSRSGLSYAEMDSIIAKHFSKITTQSTVIDRNGFNTFVSNGSSKTIRNQSRYSGTGFSV